jgi:hypothetical protein
VQPKVKNETRIQTQFCAGQVRVTGAKIYLNPHPSGVKPTGYPKPEAEQPSLAQFHGHNWLFRFLTLFHFFRKKENSTGVALEVHFIDNFYKVSL